MFGSCRRTPFLRGCEDKWWAMNLGHFLPLSTQTPAADEHTVRAAPMISQGLKNVEIWIAATLSNKDKARSGTAEWMSLKCELTKGHLTASQNKTEPKGLNKLASCTVFRTWCLYGKITVKYVWHIAFLDFKCIKKEPAFIDVVNQYLLQCTANAAGSTIPFTAHIFLETSQFFLWVTFVQILHYTNVVQNM